MFAQVDQHALTYAYLSPYAYSANSPYRYFDPDGRDIALAIDHSAAFGMGHAYLYIGSDEQGWTAFSFERQTSNFATTIQVIRGWPVVATAELTRFGAGLSLSEVINTPIQYFTADEAILVKTTEAQDALALWLAELVWEEPGLYSLYLRNCVQVALAVANAAGAEFNEGMVPNWVFRSNFQRGTIIESESHASYQRDMQEFWNWYFGTLEPEGTVTTGPIIEVEWVGGE